MYRLPMKKLMTYAEVAEFIGIEEQTFRKWIYAGTFPSPIKIGGIRRYEEETVLQFIRGSKARDEKWMIEKLAEEKKNLAKIEAELDRLKKGGDEFKFLYDSLFIVASNQEGRIFMLELCLGRDLECES